MVNADRHVRFCVGQNRTDVEHKAIAQQIVTIGGLQLLAGPGDLACRGAEGMIPEDHGGALTETLCVDLRSPRGRVIRKRNLESGFVNWTTPEAEFPDVVF
jgi:hypothetical protein